MDDRLQTLLEDFSLRGSSMFLGQKRSAEIDRGKPEKRDGRLFSKFVLAVALRGLNFPVTVRGEAQAYTEGSFDRGIDGLAIGLGQSLLTSIDNLRNVVKANQGRQPKILFLQSKLLDEKKDQRIEMNDVDLFGKNVWSFITTTWVDYEKTPTNNYVARQHKIYHALEAAYREAEYDWNPIVYLVFGVSRPYSHYAGPSQAHESNLRLIQDCLKGARVSSIIWGDEEIIAQSMKIGVNIETKLLGAQLKPIPAGPADAAYLGIISADALVNAFSTNVAGQEQLLEHYFSDNPRAQLETTEDASPGAFGIKRSIRQNNGDRILLGHNGIVLTAHTATVASDVVRLVAPQVVNGAQTCHAFFEMRHKLKGVMVPIKIIVTKDENVRDDIIVASNSQALIDGFDVLACRAEVRALQSDFHQLSWRDPQRLWLQRRRNEYLPYPGDDIDLDRTMRPKDLLNAFAAAIWRHPHTVHSDSRWALTKARQGEIFATSHDPAIYHALGWLLVVGRQWGRRQKLDWHLEAGQGSYLARHQWIHALWRIVDDTPDKVAADDLQLSGAAKERFQKIVSRLTGSRGEMLAEWASEAVRAATVVSEPRLKAFTDMASAKADEFREERQAAVA